MSSDRLLRIQHTSFGAALAPQSQQRLAELAEPVHALRGQILFQEGADNANTYLLLRGHIDLEMTVPGRGAVRILTLGPGDLVAWSAVVGDGRMTCSARVQADSDLLAVSGTKLRECMAFDHEFGFDFMRVLSAALSKRLVSTRLQLLDLFASSDTRPRSVT